ncbi:MAG: copper resistance system multicopper oxidase [Candidatus Binataceae bacterium]
MSGQTSRNARRLTISGNGQGVARGITRRRFVQGLVAGGLAAGFDLTALPALGGVSARRSQATLTGPDFNLTIEDTAVNFTGRQRIATAVNGSVPAPLLRMREGDAITISVTNRLKETSSIHWHGFRIPSNMDGVPGLSYAGIEAGTTFVYRFTLKQNGTYWYHSHTAFQEQTGLYGPVIIEPSYKDPVAYDREYVVMLSDWTDQNPEVVFNNLKQDSGYYNFHQRTVGTFASDVRRKGLVAAAENYLMWARMNMSPTDILDVNGNTYTYLINGQPPAANWTGKFRPRERVRLRVINGSTMSIFDVRIPGLPMTVVQADGNDVEPVTVDEFRISVAETYDVIVQPSDERAYTIFAQSEDRTGYARGTLAPRYGMTAAIPPMGPRPVRTMVDMGMAHPQGMNLGESNKPQEHQAPGMDMHGASSMRMERMSGMKMPAEFTATEISEFAKRAHMLGDEAPGQPDPYTSAAVIVPDFGNMAAPLAAKVQLYPSPQVDNVAAMPTERLYTAGEGFPPGRRVLAYADLRAIWRGTDPRPPDREIEIHLTGNMERFIWGFNGLMYSEAPPIRLKLGERVRFILINDTMMEHPIHLHGLWSELENGNGEFRPYKHTINVKPGEKLSYLISADTPGQWAYHCHLLYHMEAGMFRAVIVS